MRRLLGRAACALIVLVAASTIAPLDPATAGAAGPSARSGFIALRDGARLHYRVELPSGRGPFPVAMVFSPYNDGSDPFLIGNDPFTGRTLLAAGYAVVGVTMRGAGCSDGTLQLFDPQAPADGAAAVEWAARQTWSDGRVGMFGLSYPGIAQLGVAEQRPPHLRAIAPFQFAADLYRDALYPGGILDSDFAAIWAVGMQPELSSATAMAAAAQGEPECAAKAVDHLGGFVPANLVFAGHDFDDGFLDARSVGPRMGTIQVPVLACASWQDEMLGPRGLESLDLLDPASTWVLGTNGYHGICDDAWVGQRVLAFFDHFVKGRDNGFERSPHVVLAHEARAAEGAPILPLNGWMPLGPLPTTGSSPSWLSSHPTWPVQVEPVALHLASGGRLDARTPLGRQPGDPFVYPLPTASTEDGGFSGNLHAAWKVPAAPGASVSYTSAALEQDAEAFGPGSVDLWLRSTEVDTDLQVTLTEVRPDGNEVYLQRGWLRASHRTLDPRRSTVVRPFHSHTATDQRALVPGHATRVRVELPPFDHVFRAGSSIRLTVDGPTGLTGLTGFLFQGRPAVNTVLHDAAHDSQLVLGIVPGARAHAPLPACDSVISEPCRPDLGVVPPGHLRLPAAVHKR
jgi:putative CocE/NonD family hydrolase